MLRIKIQKQDLWDERNEEFVYIKENQVLELEHSLVSLSKWESKWCKPFLVDKQKTIEETRDYIRCMTLNESDVDPNCYYCLTDADIEAINKYIDSPMTATTIKKQESKSAKSIVTAEIIYYWMIALNIPFECQHWHLNRLMMLIKVCDIKSQPPKKMSKSEIMARNRAINEANRKRFNSKG